MKWIFFLFFAININAIEAQHDTLIYVGDPMCSWCYGFSPELDKIKSAFPEVPLEIVMGGLRAGGTETMMELRDFLADHWKEVQHTSGQPFNFHILTQLQVMYDTEPACRAVIIAGKMKPGIMYAYFKQVQTSFYVHNNLPNDADTYVKIAAALGLDAELFHQKYESRQAKMDAYADFELASRMGVSGFPALIAKIDNKLYLATNGYQKAEKIIALLKARGLK